MPALAVKLRADTADFESDMGRASHISEREMERMVSRATAAGQLIGQAIGRMANHFADVARSTVELGDQLSKAGQKTGFTVERLSELHFASELNDVSFKQLTSSIGFFEKQLSEAGNESTRTGQLFKALAVDITQGPQKAFEQTLKAIEQLPDQEQKIGALRAMFGRSGDALLPLIGNLEEATRKAQQLGIVVGKDFAADAEKFKDAMTQMESAQRKWVISFAPSMAGLATLAENMNSARERGELLKGTVVELGKVIMATLGAIAPSAFDKMAQDYFERAGKLSGGTGVSGMIRGAGEMGPPAPPPDVLAVQRALARMKDGTAGRSRAGASGGSSSHEGSFITMMTRMSADMAREGLRVNADLEAQARAWRDLIDPLEQYRRKQDEIRKLEALGRLTREEATDALMEVNIEMDKAAGISAKVAEATAHTWSGMASRMQETNDIARQLGMTFSSSFEQLVFGAKQGVSAMKLLEAAAMDVAKVMFRKNVTEPLASAAANAPWGAMLKDLFNGTSQAPAPVTDLSFVGGPAGYATGSSHVWSSGLARVHEGERIIPAGGSDAGIVIAPVINIDSRTDRAEVYSLVNRAVNNAVASIPDRSRRGGTYSKSVRGKA